MTYHNAVKYILSAPDDNGSEQFDRLSALLSLLDSPERKIRYVRFAGSNGKSVCLSMLASILSEASIKVGSLTMPIVDDPRQNITVDELPLSMENLVRYTEMIAGAVSLLKKKIDAKDDSLSESLITGKVDAEPTKNEIILLMSLLAFKESNCRLCLIKGDHNANDPSKFLPLPIGTVICGTIPDTNSAEARRIKSYIKPELPEIISAPQNSEAYKMISDACAAANCRLSTPVKPALNVKRLSLKGSEFSYKNQDYTVNLCGRFQMINAAVVIEAVGMLNRSGFDIDYESIYQGLKSVDIKAKFETLSIMPTIIVDSTHKSEAVGTMIETLVDFKEQTGNEVTLFISQVPSLIKEYLDKLAEFGYDVKELSLLPETTDTACQDPSLNITTSINTTYKSAAKNAIATAKKVGFVLITGNSDQTEKLRTEILRTLGY